MTLHCSSKQANQAPHNEILENVIRIEDTILQALTSTSESLQDDIKSLVVQLDNISLDPVQQTIAQFAASHRDLLEYLSNRLDAAFTMPTEFKAPSDENKIAVARQSVLDSLHFPRFESARITSSRPTTRPIGGYWSQSKEDYSAGMTLSHGSEPRLLKEGYIGSMAKSAPGKQLC